jgi:DNA polymerase-3 subunit gamma/tau
MTYVPLHHKYRPQTFQDLVGQEGIARALANGIRQQKIAPAYLFTGARGTGKTSTARIMAKSLNCLRSPVPTPYPCGECAMCLAISRGTALDVTEIDAASNTGVDNIREIIDRAQFAPVQARYKVYVIDECHMLSNAAFNALLKTLEEPPDRVVFILATTDPQRVLATIISRCQRFDFRRIPLEAMVKHLTKIAQMENIPIEPAAITLIAQLSQGGLRDSESLLDQLSLLEGTITPSMIWDLVGAVPEENLLTIVNAILTHNPIQLLEQVRHILDRGREPLIILQNLATLYRDLLIAKTAPDRGDLVAWTEGNWQKLTTLAAQLDPSQIIAAQQQLRQGELQLKNTTQPRLWLEVILMGLLEMPGVPPKPSPPKSCPEPPPQPIVPPIKPPEIKPPVAPIQTKSIATDDTDTLWQKLLNQLPPASRAVLNQQGRCLQISSNKIIIGVKTAAIQKIVEQKKAEIKAICEKLTNRKLEVEVTIEPMETNTHAVKISDPPPPPPTITPAVQAVHRPNSDRNNEAIQNLVNWFGGEVIDP